jgi:hypothetical protein
MHALTIMMNKAAKQEPRRSSLLSFSLLLLFFLLFLFQKLANLFQGAGFHCIYHKNLACASYILDIISGCLMLPEMKASTTCILVMLPSHLTHMHDISIYNNLEYIMPLCTNIHSRCLHHLTIHTPMT